MIRPSLLGMLLLFSYLNTGAQERALLLIDIQEVYFPGGELPLNQPEVAGINAGLLLESFRKSGDHVIHVSHAFGSGEAIHAYVAPREGEIRIKKDHVNAFLGTELREILRRHGIRELIICGMQTHLCVEAAVRAASDLGYEVMLIADACATGTLQYGERIVDADQVQACTLATLQAYATILNTSEYLIMEKIASGRGDGE